MPRLIENIHHDSTVKSIQIWGSETPFAIDIHYKNNTSVFISEYKIVYFFNQQKTKLSADVQQAIKEAFAPLFKKYNEERPTAINLEKVLQLYSHLFQLIAEYKNKFNIYPNICRFHPSLAIIDKKIGDILLKKHKGYTYLASDMVEEIKKLLSN